MSEKLYLKELPSILDTEPFVFYVVNQNGKFIRRATKQDIEKLEIEKIQINKCQVKKCT